jgi:predicted transposase YbfD/YdcC
MVVPMAARISEQFALAVPGHWTIENSLHSQPRNNISMMLLPKLA